MSEQKPAGFFSRVGAAVLDFFLFVVAAVLLSLFLRVENDFALVFELSRMENLEQIMEEEWVQELSEMEQSLGELNFQDLPPSTQARIETLAKEEFEGLETEFQALGDPRELDVETITQLLPDLMQKIKVRADRLIDRVEAEELQGITQEQIQFFRDTSSTVLNTGKLMEVALAYLWRVLRIFLIFLFIYAGYHGIEALFGASPGKMVLGMRVTDSEGRPSNLFQNIIRNVVKLFPTGFLIACIILENPLLLIGALLSWFVFSFLGNALILGSSHRSLVDRVSGSAVYFRRNMND
jgi:hypothetical protein